MHKIAGFARFAAAVVLSSTALGGVALAASTASAAPGAQQGTALVLADGGAPGAGGSGTGDGTGTGTGTGQGDGGSGSTGAGDPAASPSPSAPGVSPQTWGWGG